MPNRQSSDQVAAKAAAMMVDPLPRPQIEVLLLELDVKISDESVESVRKVLAAHLRDVRAIAASVVSQADGPEA